MTTYVTVNTSASSSVLVPFTSAANAQFVQGLLNATTNAQAIAGTFTYFKPGPTVSGNVTVPATTTPSGVAQTNSNPINYGQLPQNYTTLVNGAVDSVGAAGQGGGTAAVISNIAATVLSGTGAQTVFLNAAAAGTAFLGGSAAGDAVQNVLATSKVNIYDGGLGGPLANLLVNDSIGGGATVRSAGNLQVSFTSGGSDSVFANGGTTYVRGLASGGSAAGVLTVAAASAATTLQVYAGGAPMYITPGAGTAYVFQQNASENAVTLFGGQQQVIGGQTLSAGTFTGQAFVNGVNGYLMGGRAGGNVLQSGTTAGAATLVAGGAGDFLIVRGAGDTAQLGDLANVSAYAAPTVTPAGAIKGEKFTFGSGSGTAVGASGGYNDFVFNGSGSYTVTGSHDYSVAATAAGGLKGSVYHESAFAGGGSVTILDFLPQQVATTVVGGATLTAGGAIFDQFDVGNRSAVITSTVVSGAGANTIYNDTATLSDGTVINFRNTLGTVHQVGTFLQ